MIPALPVAHRQRVYIMVQGAAALAPIVGGLLALDDIAAQCDLPSDDIASRIGFALKWLLLPGLTLYAGIQGTAIRRMFTEDIDGTRTPRAHALEINLRYNQNTLEQTVLAAIAWGGLALVLPVAQLAVIPFFAILFVTGRAFFWLGYLYHPAARAFGMLLTLMPNVVALLWAIMKAFLV